jgi:hypothetical protein
MQRPTWIIALAALIVGLCSQADGARLIGVEIEHQGKSVLTTYYSDNGYPPREEVWKYLGRTPIMVEDKSVAITPSPDDPLKAKLEGDVVISISRTGTRAKFKDLMLVRDDAAVNKWYLPAGEVKRTANVAGLLPATAPPQPIYFRIRSIPWLVIFALLIIGGAFVVFLQLRSPKQSYQ